MHSIQAIVRDIMESPETLGERVDVIVRTALRSELTLDDLLNEVEKRYLLAQLAEVNGNQCQAAVRMHMHRNTLARKIAAHQLHVERKRPERALHEIIRAVRA
jgi:DNA-binding NtrC family response regulator